MSSPVKIPFKNIIQTDRSSTMPVYLQIARQLINAVQRGVIAPGVQLPGSRALSETLHVHRKTIIAAYTELELQGWTETRPNQGTFVAGTKTIAQNTNAFSEADLYRYPSQSGYRVETNILLDIPDVLPGAYDFEFTDGAPDVRLAPMEKLSQAISSVLKRKRNRRFLERSGVEGNDFYREKLAAFLNQSRGLPVTMNNILTTKGSEMGIYLTSALLIERGNDVIVGQPSYYVANMIFQQAGANILSVPVDQHGISVEAIERLCRIRSPRLVYITPHHHYPTTVTLSAERRLDLLKLADKYGLIILEDDHDYDFHYHSAPLLPLASADMNGMVVYIGSFSTALAPGIQSGYIVAPENVIHELGKLRQIIDRQGDMLLEQALAELISDGELQRHLKKAQKVYHERRDLCLTLLGQYIGADVRFDNPPGGLSVWTRWQRPVNLLRLSRDCAKKGLLLPQTLLYQTGQLTAMRLGFGNMAEDEMKASIQILAEMLRVQ